jgi:hypothetical protein
MFHRNFGAYLFRKERTVQIVLAFACGGAAGYLSTLHLDGAVNFGLGLTLAYLASHIFNIINIEWPAYKRSRANLGVLRAEMCRMLSAVKKIIENGRNGRAPDVHDAHAVYESIGKMTQIGSHDLQATEALNSIEQAIRAMDGAAEPVMNQRLLELAKSIYHASRKDPGIASACAAQGLDAYYSA